MRVVAYMTPIRRTALILVAVVAAMTLLTAYSVPLYRLFCQVTGFGGTPIIGEPIIGAKVDGINSPMDSAQAMPLRVSFDTSQSPDLNWIIGEPRPIDIKTGRQLTAFYTAANPSDEAVSGMSVFNVTPDGVAPYVHKIACFCFEEQTLSPKEERQMRIDFYIDPKVFAEPRFKNLSVVTFSYSFFKAGG